VAAWDADAVYSGTQKCLSAPPGLSPIALSKRAQAAISARKTKVRNWLCDFNLLMSYWGGEGGRTYHHTAPINALYGLHESLVAIFEEGQQAVQVRHARTHEALAAGIEAAGLKFLVAPSIVCPSSTPSWFPMASMRRLSAAMSSKNGIWSWALVLDRSRARSGGSASWAPRPPHGMCASA